MIRYATDQDVLDLKKIWKICFKDTDEFINLYFAYKYKNTNTIVYIDNNKVVASLYMIPYTINFYSHEIPFYYLSGLSTLPEYREKGYMSQLIYQAHEIMKERGISLSILIPAEEWLYNYYSKFNYKKVFESSNEPVISIKNILDSATDFRSAYQYFDSIYRAINLCVQKTYDDFIDIIKDLQLDDFPPKYNLSGMACIIDVKYLLSIYANFYSNINLKIRIENDADYKLEEGLLSVVERVDFTPDLIVSKSDLCRLIFGFKVTEMEQKYNYSKYFSDQSPIMNLMLE